MTRVCATQTIWKDRSYLTDLQGSAGQEGVSLPPQTQASSPRENRTCRLEGAETLRLIHAFIRDKAARNRRLKLELITPSVTRLRIWKTGKS